MPARARRPNPVKTSTLKLSTTPQVVARLDALALTGLYGKNGTEVAEELLRLKLREVEIPAWAEQRSKRGSAAR
ncbi:MAG: hypothetical protein ACXW5U_14080 [Thermoanaerobaculia bacterium]